MQLNFCSMQGHTTPVIEAEFTIFRYSQFNALFACPNARGIKQVYASKQCQLAANTHSSTVGYRQLQERHMQLQERHMQLQVNM